MIAPLQAAIAQISPHIFQCWSAIAGRHWCHSGTGGGKWGTGLGWGSGGLIGFGLASGHSQYCHAQQPNALVHHSHPCGLKICCNVCCPCWQDCANLCWSLSCCHWLNACSRYWLNNCCRVASPATSNCSQRCK